MEISFQLTTEVRWSTAHESKSRPVTVAGLQPARTSSAPFVQNLAAVSESVQEEDRSSAIDRRRFGAGKSHLLDYLEHVALSELCCSRIGHPARNAAFRRRQVYLAAFKLAVFPVSAQPITRDRALS